MDSPIWHLNWREFEPLIFYSLGGDDDPYLCAPFFCVGLLKQTWHLSTTCDMTVPHVTWRYHMWHDGTTCDMTVPHVTWRYHMWHDGTTCDKTVPLVTWRYGTTCDMTWHDRLQWTVLHNQSPRYVGYLLTPAVGCHAGSVIKIGFINGNILSDI
jgi:hypothetical protein